MNPDLAFALVAFTSLVAIYNPLSAAPIFVAMTANQGKRERHATAFVGILTSVVVMGVFALAGNWILGLFGITTEAFKITGGVIFFSIGSDMLQARRSRVKTTEAEEEEAVNRSRDMAVIPLGLPTLSGPGTIATVIALVAQAANVFQLLSVYAAILLTGLVTWPILILSPTLMKSVGHTGLNVMTRIMGLLVMVIGVQFVIDGITTVVGNLGLGSGGIGS